MFDERDDWLDKQRNKRRGIQQNTNNPYSVLLSPKEWVEFEYKAQRGSMPSLIESARRYNLLADLKKDPTVTIAQYAAWEYLLGVSLD